MPAKGIGGAHLVRYGTAADQKFLVGPFTSTYDQLVINANMVAHMPGALATLVTQHARKPFFIDPQTHAFQHAAEHIRSTKTGELRKSIARLVAAYGEPVAAPVLRGDMVIPDDFTDAVIPEFCTRVLDFQQHTLKAEVEESPDAKYYAFVAENEGAAGAFNSVHPSLLVAPYFYLDGRTYAQWLDVNLKCAERSVAEAATRDMPLGVQIVLSQDVLRTQAADLARRYGQLKPDYFLVWVDDLVEHDTSRATLQALVDLFAALGATAPVVNLYGGYFSVALMHTGRAPELAGVTHSLEYGESRAVVPVGGGVPVAKFYLPNLHTRLLTRDAVRAIRTLEGFSSRGEYLGKICDCQECQMIIQNVPEQDFAAYGETNTKVVKGRGGPVAREYPTTGTKEHCVRHYMWAKEREYAETLDAPSTCKALRETSAKLRRTLGDEVGHCEVWAAVLET
jgi:hypothetical protein